MGWGRVGAGCRFRCVEGVRSSRHSDRSTRLSVGYSDRCGRPGPQLVVLKKRLVGKLIERAGSARLCVACCNPNIQKTEAKGSTAKGHP